MIDNEALLECDVDLLIPAAREGQLTERNANRIKASTIVEAAKGPTTPQVDANLERRGIEVVPDILAKAGGVTVSYFEWAQNRSGVPWTEQEVHARLQQTMRRAFGGVVQTAKRKGGARPTRAQSSRSRRQCPHPERKSSSVRGASRGEVTTT